jgi:hypothetical protein
MNERKFKIDGKEATEENLRTLKKTCKVLPYPPQIPHGVAWNWTWPSVLTVRSRVITSWATYDTATKCFERSSRLLNKFEGRVHNCCSIHVAWGYLGLISSEVSGRGVALTIKFCITPKSRFLRVLPYLFAQLGAFAQRKLLLCTLLA